MNSLFRERQLESLKSIRPDPVFLRWSKKAILMDTTPERKRIARGIPLSAILSHAIRPLAAAGALTIAAFAFMAHAPEDISFIASLDPQDIAIERLKIASDDKSAEAKYFKSISPSISLALTDIIDPSTDYGSADHIKKGIALLGRN